MSVTVFIRSKRGVRRIEPGKRWFLLPVALIACLVGIWHWSEQRVLTVATELAMTHQRSDSQQDKLLQLRDQTEAQLSVLAARLGRIQARMNRVEAVGIALAERSDLSEQFDFNSEVGLGGVDVPDQSDIELDLLLAEMDELMIRLDRVDNQLPLLESLERHHHIESETYLSGRPLTNGWQSSSFGYRNDPFNGRRRMHRGLDFAGPEGGEVIATGAGVVSYSGTMFGYGNLVEVDHGNGLKTRYGHNKDNLVELGQVVEKGEVIATIGSTGRSTGPHVHYEVLENNVQVDPARYVYRKPRS
ncbi:M23 family metallopeptidase [Ferrimonas marina]|uniref:Peptidase family M23 n=1 Tax=Ferrimonas marina TaxID=299255 RepID=A0A1M5XFC5_9GAMM|nr:M23 family metallopeptidase [Ferrimonas marina]SHH98520.1 Peptidase family M23 [Ferrimonas marina]